jgi:hypothetical protein
LPNATVHTDREDALIVWDGARHIEHFVRSAVFASTAKSFGFLVPTPSRPTLAEASGDVAATLGDITKPAVVDQKTYELEPVGCTNLAFFSLARSKSGEPVVLAAAPVTVLEETRVSGLDATVLDASDPEALASWLQAHNFEFRDALKRWVAPYLQQKWIITAFRYERPEVASNAWVGGQDSQIASRAVRMSFATDSPVYPYREPDDTTSNTNRELRLFVVASGRVEGWLATPGNPWGASLRYAAPLAPSAQIASALPGVALPASMWLSEFSDRTALRPPSDLLLRASGAHDEIHPAPTVVLHRTDVPIPYEVPFVALFVGLWWRRRKRRA